MWRPRGPAPGAQPSQGPPPRAPRASPLTRASEAGPQRGLLVTSEGAPPAFPPCTRGAPLSPRQASWARGPRSQQPTTPGSHRAWSHPHPRGRELKAPWGLEGGLEGAAGAGGGVDRGGRREWTGQAERGRKQSGKMKQGGPHTDTHTATHLVTRVCVLTCVWGHAHLLACTHRCTHTLHGHRGGDCLTGPSPTP